MCIHRARHIWTARRTRGAFGMGPSLCIWRWRVGFCIKEIDPRTWNCSWFRFIVDIQVMSIDSVIVINLRSEISWQKIGFLLSRREVDDLRGTQLSPNELNSSSNIKRAANHFNLPPKLSYSRLWTGAVAPLNAASVDIGAEAHLITWKLFEFRIWRWISFNLSI
jgi:hypothetical protein